MSPGPCNLSSQQPQNGLALGEIASAVLADYDKLQLELNLVNQGMSGMDKFYGLFHRDLREDIKKCGDEWVQLANELRTTISAEPKDLSRQLKGILHNNAKWLEAAGKQFVSTVTDFD